MSLSQHEPAYEQPTAPDPNRPQLERRRVPYPEGAPLMSLLAAAVISFVFLSTSSWTLFPFLMEFLNEGGGLGPLSLPTLSDSVLIEALVGTAILTIVSLTILMAERHHKFPSWLPFVASFPVAWALTLPSALEHGGALPMWVAFGAMLAGTFCSALANTHLGPNHLGLTAATVPWSVLV